MKDRVVQNRVKFDVHAKTTANDNKIKQSNPVNTKLIPSESPPRYEKVKHIASGSYGEVYQGIDNVTGEKVAIKKISDIFESPANAKRLIREIMILDMLRGHPNIVSLKHLKPRSDPNKLELIFNYGDFNLAQLFGEDHYLTNSQIQHMLFQLLCGIKYMHAANIVHRDIKPANILMNKNYDVQICDFGLSRLLGLDDSANKKPNFTHEYNFTNDVSKPPQLLVQTIYVVTRWYRSPELMLLTQRYSKAIDMWSAGCVFGEMLMMLKESGYTPERRSALFPGRSCYPLSADTAEVYKDNEDQLNLIFNLIGTPSIDDLRSVDNLTVRHYLANLKPVKPKDLALTFPNVDPLALDLLKKLLVFNPAKRITAEEALKHPFFKIHDAKMNMIRYLSPHINADSLKRYYDFEVELEKQKTVKPISPIPALHKNGQVYSEIKQQDDRRNYIEQERKKIELKYKDQNYKTIRNLIMQEVNKYNNKEVKNSMDAPAVVATIKPATRDVATQTDAVSDKFKARVVKQAGYTYVFEKGYTVIYPDTPISNNQLASKAAVVSAKGFFAKDDSQLNRDRVLSKNERPIIAHRK